MTTNIELEIHNRAKRFKEAIAKKAEELKVSKQAKVTPVPKLEPQAHADVVDAWVARQLNSPNAFPIPPKTLFSAIQIALCEYFGLTKEELCAPNRTAHLAYARQIGMFFVKKHYPHWSLPEIGRRFGGRDHTTVLHGVRKIEGLLAKGDIRVLADVKAIEALLQ